jgi:glycerol-3-phosphate dehydrogenase
VLEPVLPAAAQREGAIRELESRVFDLLVIGGGITGAGVAREAARRGLSVALLDAHDFAAGTSSRSTKLVHGGLRYLAHGDVRLVRETALERKHIHSLAPHLAEPLWMVRPARRYGAWLGWRAGIALYERLGAVDAAERHRNWSSGVLAREEPLLAARFRHATAYREYRTDDARLVLANLRGAAAAGACALNHARVCALREEDPQAVQVEVRCALGDATFRVRARCVVNAAGPWVEAVRGCVLADTPPWLHLTRGIHVALPLGRLPLRNMVMLEARDGRMLFAIPRGSIVYVGTTDTSCEGEPELWPSIPRAEVEYLLEPLSRHFAIEPVGPEEVVSAWAGLRPLVAQPGRTPSEISRRDEIQVGPGRLVSIAGGKLTGYAPMARAVLARVARVLGRELAQPAEEPPLPGGDLAEPLAVCAQRLSSRFGIELGAAERLMRLYGAEADAVLGLGSEPLSPDACVVTGEIEWAVTREAAVTLEDVFYRRTRVAPYEPAAAQWIEPMAAQTAKLLSWTEARRKSEVARVRERLACDLHFREVSR